MKNLLELLGFGPKKEAATIAERLADARERIERADEIEALISSGEAVREERRKAEREIAAHEAELEVLAEMVARVNAAHAALPAACAADGRAIIEADRAMFLAKKRIETRTDEQRAAHLEAQQLAERLGATVEMKRAVPPRWQVPELGRELWKSRRAAGLDGELGDIADWLAPVRHERRD